MKAIEDMREVLTAEVDLAESLLKTMVAQRDAIIAMDAERVAETVIQEQTLIKPMLPLERERMRLAGEIIGRRKLAPDDGFPMREILACLTEEEGRPLQSLGARLKSLTMQITEINRQNRLLLEQSLSFVRENIRALTENYSRALVDQKI
jgi:hypothetical protein